MNFKQLLTDIAQKLNPKKDMVVHPASGKEYKTLDTHPKFTQKGHRRKDVVTYKFTAPQRRQILMMIAHCKTTREIMAVVKDQMQMEISAAQVHEYRHSKKWNSVITKEREAYLGSLSETPGYNDKIRLERSETVYEKAISDNNLKMALLAVDQQRREVKEAGKSPVSFVFQHYSNMTDEELQDKYNQALIKVGEHKKKSQAITIKKEEPKDGTSGV